ncbi:MAG: biotin/lipoyl-binding protein [Paludibacteraceae bacterium]|nr:biotin/lipoyl-binding protein [Paludibacteraceae bacterium]
MKEFKFVIDGHSYTTSVNEIDNNVAEVTVNGTVFRVNIEKEEKAETVQIRRPQTTATAKPAAAKGTQTIVSPLPGSIMKVLVSVGQKVSVGDVLLSLESMKMENQVKAEQAGTVKAIFVEAGKNVMQDDKLLELELEGVAEAPKAEPAKTVAKPQPVAEPAPQPKPQVAPAGGTKVVSPLPGSVIKVLVAEGQAVKRGDTLLTLESMKMENAIKAEQDGIVKQIAVQAGQNVMQDDLLVVLG